MNATNEHIYRQSNMVWTQTNSRYEQDELRSVTNAATLKKHRKTHFFNSTLN